MIQSHGQSLVMNMIMQSCHYRMGLKKGKPLAAMYESNRMSIDSQVLGIAVRVLQISLQLD